ncbi:MAG: glycosyltransferase [Cytophagales bacterium]|nr:glycosyltransferase [Bernardetiaceae bacterium]MDW8204868.1 glycosyltransferase [Cytophagales bacterium]
MQVSVILAVRNEEHHLSGCLEALAVSIAASGLQCELLIGDDGSTDQTRAIAECFAQTVDFPCKIVEVVGSIGLARGKANAVGQIIPHASAEILLITDADTRVPKTWVAAMAAAFTPSIALVTGFTLVGGSKLHAQLQAVDWAIALGSSHLLASLGLPLTSLGNNMAYRKSAYLQTGGYEKLPLYITEDLALLKAVRQKGWQTVHLANRAILASTAPATSWKEWILQRKRWLAGALSMPWLQKGLMLTDGLLLFGLIPIATVNAMAALQIWGCRFAVHALIGTVYLLRMKQGKKLLLLPLYELLITFLNPLVFLHYLAFRYTEWKQRHYDL